MAGLPINFAVPGESSISSYSWTDIADGTGIINFYGCAACTSSSTYAYFLTTNTSLNSAHSGTSSLVNGDNTFTFDVVLNTPRILQGNAYISVPILLTSTDGGAASPAYTKCTIYHVDTAATETAISSEITSETITQPSGAGSTLGIFVSKLALTTKNFSPGETLRVKVIANWVDGAGTQYASIGYSPTNQVPSWSTSQLLVQIPVRLDL